jgi:hypothetical protein
LKINTNHKLKILIIGTFMKNYSILSSNKNFAGVDHLMQHRKENNNLSQVSNLNKYPEYKNMDLNEYN